MKIFNRRGSALMQVMVMGSIIAAIIIMLMRYAEYWTQNNGEAQEALQIH